MTPAKPPSIDQMKVNLQKFYDWVANNNTMPTHKGTYQNSYLDQLTDVLLDKQAQTFVADQMTQDAIKEIFGGENKVNTSKFESHEVANIHSLKTLAWGKWGKLQTILPYAYLTQNLAIAGGCFTSWFHGDEPKDIDVFFFGDDDQRDYFASLLERLNNTQPCVRSQYRVNNDQITDVFNELSGFQFILTKYKTREEVVKHFDYSHCMVSFDGDKLYISRETYDAIKNKHLIVNNQERIAEWRTAKFLARGFVDPTVPHDRGMSWQVAARINPVRKMKTTPMIDPWFPA